MSENLQEKMSPSQSQTLVHVAGALTIALFVGLALLLTRTFGHAHKSHQIEQIQQVAMTDLKLIFDQEKKFRELHGFYTTDLNQLGITPKKVLYKFGFTVASKEFHEGIDPTIMDLDILKTRVPKLEMDFSPVTKLNEVHISKLQKDCPDCTATADSFKAIAAANLNDDPELDIWTVDQDGTVMHLRDDLRKSGPAERFSLVK